MATLDVPFRLLVLNFGTREADTDRERKGQTCREAGTQSQRSWMIKIARLPNPIFAFANLAFSPSLKLASRRLTTGEPPNVHRP